MPAAVAEGGDVGLALLVVELAAGVQEVGNGLGRDAKADYCQVLLDVGVIIDVLVACRDAAALDHEQPAPMEEPNRPELGHEPYGARPTHTAAAILEFLKIEVPRVPLRHMRQELRRVPPGQDLVADVGQDRLLELAAVGDLDGNDAVADDPVPDGQDRIRGVVVHIKGQVHRRQRCRDLPAVKVPKQHAPHDASAAVG